MVRAVTLSIVLLLAAAGSAFAVGPETSSLDSDPFYRDAVLLIENKDYETAILKLQRVLKDNPEAPEVLNWLGYSFRKLKDYPTSKLYYDAALKVDPNYLPAIEYQGEWFIETGDFDSARTNLSKLQLLCGKCHEYEDLARALRLAEALKRTKTSN